MGMNRPGEIARLTEIADPHIGLITNVARAHIEGLGDINGVARAKVELLEKISSDSQVVLNGDDELLMSVASQFSKKMITYGLESKNDIRAENIINLGREGLSFELRFQGDSVPIRLRSPGLQNVFNALAASSIAICLEEPYDHIVEGLYGFKGIKGRFMINTLPGGITLVDDTYNSNPSSLKAAIDSVKELMANGGRVMVGLGEMLELGDDTMQAHMEAGAMVAEIGVSYFFAMGEHAPEMIKGALTRGFPPDRAVAVNSHEEMGKKIKENMKNGDLILLKGSRGMALEKVSDILKRRSKNSSG
jgi:UDP-N-acetylmuramoyl-tripeptide--D-alanyl-D-alanine ligase